MNVTIPNSFRATIKQTFGDEGEKWLDQLPTLIEFYMKGWNLTPDGEFSDLTFNFTLPVRLSDNETAVLKLGPHPRGRAREAAALKAYDGEGAVQLLKSSAEDGVLLLSRATPGEQLKSLLLKTADDEGVTEIACGVVEKLLASEAERANHTHISTWGLGFEKHLREYENGPIDSKLVDRADRLFKQLIRTSPSETLLHGDLHHSNILSSDNGWLAIDPKGVWGDPTFEVGAFVRNPMPELLTFSDLEQKILNRMEILSDNLSLDIERVWAWSYAQSVLAAIWAVRDQTEVARWLKVTEILEKLEDDL
jgi:streptomycin 6-kinase